MRIKAILLFVALTAVPAQAQLRTILELPAVETHPGDTFYVRAHLDNPDGPALYGVPLVVVIQVGAEFYFWPSWQQEFDYLRFDVPVGTRNVTVIPAMMWPDTGEDAGAATFHAAMLTENLSEILGEMDSFDWTFGPEFRVSPSEIVMAPEDQQYFRAIGYALWCNWWTDPTNLGELASHSGQSVLFTAGSEVFQGNIWCEDSIGRQSSASITISTPTATPTPAPTWTPTVTPTSTPTPCPTIYVVPENPTVQIGDTIQLHAAGGTEPYTWDSSFPFVGTIDDSGLFRAGPFSGVTTVTATDAALCDGNTDVTVIP